MSGSGPTVFAAFTERQQAQQYYQKVKQEYPGAIFGPNGLTENAEGEGGALWQ